MAFHIIAGEENFFLDLFTKVENAKPADIKLAHDQFEDKPIPEILRIEGDTAFISIEGPLSPKGPSPIARFFGFEGTAYNAIVEAVGVIKDHENDIKNVELLMDTPGGTIAGVDVAAQSIASLKKDFKVTARNLGMIASAGYWIASQAERIVSLSDVHRSGSIGVIIVGFDDTEFLKEVGFKRITIRSRNAPDKAPGVETKKEIANLQIQADNIENVFISKIAAGRNLDFDFITKNFGRGALLVSKNPRGDSPDALSVKMIDSIDFKLETSDNVPDADVDFNFTNSEIDENSSEVKNMDILELLKLNPDAMESYNKALSANAEKCLTDFKTKENERLKTLSAKINPFVAKDSKYPDGIRTQAMGLVDGSVSGEAFDAAVTAHDQAVEGIKSETASTTINNGGDGGNNGDTGESSVEGELTQDGEIKTQADFDAEVIRMKTMQGVK